MTHLGRIKPHMGCLTLASQGAREANNNAPSIIIKFSAKYHNVFAFKYNFFCGRCALIC